jgi:casein kinase I homolog HRR25
LCNSAESSRRDDLESLAYMLIYFLRGCLPWRRIRGPNVTATWDLIRDKKLETEALLTVGLPREFDVLYRYARGLEFEDLPDYKGLREMFRTLGARHGITYDDVFDWGKGREGKGVGRTGKSRACRACEACDQRNR